MPGGDGTGPLGRGPMTGRGMGYCVVRVPDGGRSARGFAGAAGWPVKIVPPAAQEIAYLQGCVGHLTEELARMRARIRYIERGA
jgi:hypothetical protein